MSVASAIRRFHPQRGAYYAYLASFLEASDGKIVLGSIFERDAERFAQQPRGVLSAEWRARYEDNGANLAAAWSGTLPEVEVGIVQVAQSAGSGALSTTLQDLARIAALADDIREAIVSTLTMAVIGAVIALVMVTLFPLLAVAQLKEQFAFLPVEEWGPKASLLVNYAEAVKSFGPYLVLLVAGGMWALARSFEQFVGPMRERCDRQVFFYRTFRDLRASLFLSVMAILTRKRGNVIYTLGESVEMLRDGSRSPWMAWRLQQIVQAIHESGAVTPDVFNTGLLSPEMFYYLRDIQEVTDFSAAFEKTRKFVETDLIKRLKRHLVFYRWGALLSAVAVMVAVLLANAAVIYEMTETIRTL